MRIQILAVLVIGAAWASCALADANDGEFFGFELGARYLETDNRQHDDERLVLVATKDPVKPDSIDSVYVLVTPVSRSIGKIAGEAWFQSGEDAIVAYERFRSFLRNKYENWDSEEQSDVNRQVSQFTNGDYVLVLQVTGPHRTGTASAVDKPFQLVLTLAYAAGSRKANEFETMAAAEIREAANANLAEKDIRGL